MKEGSLPFFQFLDRLSKESDVFIQTIAQATARAEIHKRVRKIIAETSPSSVIRAGNIYQSSIERVIHSELSDSWNLVQIAHEIENFLGIFDDALRLQREDTSVNLLWAAKYLSAKLTGITHLAEAIQRSLELPETQASEEILTIRIEADVSIRDIHVVLNGLQNSYDIVRKLVDRIEETASSDVQLVKLETGSLSVILKGAAGVIGVLGKFLKGFLGHATLSYRFQVDQVGIKSTTDMLALRNALKESGLSVDGLDEEIVAAAVSLARQNKQLAQRAAEIRIDGTLVGLSGDLKTLLGTRRALEDHSKTPLREDRQNLLGSSSGLLEDHSGRDDES